MVPTMMATSATAQAEPKGQLRDCRKRSTRALPMKKTLPPPSSCGIRYSPISRMNTSMQPVMTPGADSGNVTWRKVPQALGSLQQALIELFQADEYGKDHEGHIAVDDADEHRQGRVDQADIGKSDPAQQRGYAASAQDEHPGICPDQKTGPEGYDHQDHQEKATSGRGLERQEIGQRIADQKADQRAHRCQGQ